MKKIAVYLNDRFVGYYIADDMADLRKIKNLIARQLAIREMPTVPITDKKRSKTIYKKKVEEIKKSLVLVYEL